LAKGLTTVRKLVTSLVALALIVPLPALAAPEEPAKVAAAPA
jgi:hypothetical protein